MSVFDKMKRLFTKNKGSSPGHDSSKNVGGAWFIALLLVYILFLLLGAGIFRELEYKVKRTHDVVDEPRWAKIKNGGANSSSSEEENRKHLAWLMVTCPHTNTTLLDGVFRKHPANFTRLLESNCTELQFKQESNLFVYHWTFIDALYFSMTVTTTIGYGHIIPSRPCSKVVCMLYAIIGLPFTGVLLTVTSKFFGGKIFKVYRFKVSHDKQQSQVYIVCITIIYIAIGFVIFLFLPAAAFAFMEEWSYLDGVYYAFITLTTIGFGDFVTGRNMNDGPKLVTYQVMVLMWIITSLGYWVMVANFIARAVRSKKLHDTLRNRTKWLKKMRTIHRRNNSLFRSQGSHRPVNFTLKQKAMLVLSQEHFGDQLDA